MSHVRIEVKEQLQIIETLAVELQDYWDLREKVLSSDRQRSDHGADGGEPAPILVRIGLDLCIQCLETLRDVPGIGLGD